MKEKGGEYNFIINGGKNPLNCTFKVSPGWLSLCFMAFNSNVFSHHKLLSYRPNKSMASDFMCA